MSEAKQAMPSNAPRILISRLSHIGDCILTIPVANAIRQAYPDAFIAWAIESPGDRMIKECRSVDEVIVVPKSWLKKPLQTWRLRKRLRSYKFDIAIDPQSLTKSAGISWLSGARQRIGLQKPLGRELSPWLNNRLVSVGKRHVVDRSLEMLQALNIEQPAVDFDLVVPEDAQQIAEEIIQSCSKHRQFVVVNPGAGWKSRQWCNQRFGQVCNYLASQHDLTPLVTWFGDAEEAMANEIVKASDGAAVKSPSTKLWELGGLIQKSLFYMGCDTGPTHLAAALNTSCITLFGTTESDISGPYEMDVENPSHIYLQAYYQAGSSRERRKAENEAMMQIEIGQVCEAVDQMVSGKTSDKSEAA